MLSQHGVSSLSGCRHVTVGTEQMKVLLPRMSTGPGGVRRFSTEMLREFTSLLGHDPTLVYLHPADWGTGWRDRTSAAVHAVRSMAYARPEPTFACFHIGWNGRGTAPLVGFVHDLRGPKGLELGQDRGRAALLRRVPILQRSSIRSWDIIAVPSPHVADDVQFLWPRARVECIGEGIDHLARPPMASAASRHSIVVVGGAMPHKRTDVGVAAARELRSRVDATRIWVLGELDPGRSAERGVQRVVTDEDWSRALSEARLAIAPTAYEGFGLGVGEAVHAGVPVVYAKDSGLDWVVGGAGLASDPGAASMADIGAAIWDQPERYIAKTFEQSQRFSWRSTASHALRLLGYDVGA